MNIDLEKLLDKKKKEITFYEDTKEMIDFAEKKNDKDIYERFAEHFTTLAQIDGIKEDMLKVAKYFYDRANDHKSLS